jgi:hypothetical protein
MPGGGHAILHRFAILDDQNRSAVHQMIETRHSIADDRQKDVEFHQGDDDKKGIRQGIISLIQSALRLQSDLDFHRLASAGRGEPKEHLIAMRA